MDKCEVEFWTLIFDEIAFCYEAPISVIIVASFLWSIDYCELIYFLYTFCLEIVLTFYLLMSSESDISE